MIPILLFVSCMLMMTSPQLSRSLPVNYHSLHSAIEKFQDTKVPEKFSAQVPEPTENNDDICLLSDEPINIDGGLYGISPRYQNQFITDSDLFITLEIVTLVSVNATYPWSSLNCSGIDTVPLPAAFKSYELHSTGTPSVQQSFGPPPHPTYASMAKTTYVSSTESDAEPTWIPYHAEVTTDDDDYQEAQITIHDIVLAEEECGTPSVQQSFGPPPHPTYASMAKTTYVSSTESDAEPTWIPYHAEVTTDDDHYQEAQITIHDIVLAEEECGTVTVLFGMSVVLIVVMTMLVSFFVMNKEEWVPHCFLNITTPQFPKSRGREKSTGLHQA
ncbi:uncharacterized protein LOC124368621 [Homalodisca vitripennis]|uniref:uncharacterized protein LOC124368621 n=1 Tax=Homalodisca vitripennis TaxID=197043 RepID=UPI001EEA895E|nr:uncharacterized protein LOC124368621 [Homalodisca vitripennis]